MKFFLAKEAALKWLETPSVYHIRKDDLYELDVGSFSFLKKCASEPGCNSNNSDFIMYCLKEGILTKDEIKLKRPPVLQSPVPSLRYLELQITNRCNLRCKHCFVNGEKYSELSVTHIRDILKEFEEMQGLRVLISGGEPTVHRSFERINELLPDFLIRKVLFTNGLLLNRRTLKKLHVDEIQVSIDGLEASHDLLRGKGTYKKAIKAAKNALDCGFEVSVSTMVHSGNLNDFQKMENLFRSIGIKDWTVDIPCVTGRLKENPELYVTPEVAGAYFRYGYGEGLHTGPPMFACGLHLMGITADGRVAKCTFFSEYSVGTIDEGLRQCWQKIKPVRLDELRCNCEHIESCRGGCRYRALLLGNPYGEDLYKCYYYGKINK